MRKAIVLVVFVATIGCAKKETVKPEQLNYSLLDSIYKRVDVEVKNLVSDVAEREGKLLAFPRYIKVYRGSFKDEQGNVVEGGFEFIKVYDGEPNTNF